MSMKWISLIIGGVIIIAGVWFLFQPNSAISPVVEDILSQGSTNNKNANTPAKIKYGYIEYRDSGFSPRRITIKKGETVTFVNKSKTGMWVAGNYHPTHTQYPEKSSSDCLGTTFDECKVVSPGESWKFKFNIAGTWGYHNHIRPVYGGRIEVK